ncbi:MAG TPA: hypothetical protein VHG28_04975, partial [Longimicrobiaceae bacterium]|nr:hypothetical protein [Longimicrobiaceae bacterium]
PPLLLQIPVASVEAGLAGFGRGIVLSQVTIGGAFTGSLSGFSLVAFQSQNLGLALDLGLAGYGALKLLGMNLCTLYWPLWMWHGDATLSTGMLLTASASSTGASASLTVNPPVLNAVPFSSLPLDIPRGMFADDCPLCDVFYALGLMPSQNGGGWHGHPTPPWMGPLWVYPRDPGIPSGAKCRGACGPDCDTCTPPVDLIVCEETPDGRHVFWMYPNYQECGSHDGCRQHDGSYDWCAAGGEMSILGPCHRVADFECICNYGAPQCVGWIFGSPPHDSVMAFSDAPYVTGFCVGPCPEATVTPTGETQFQLCLPDIPLVDRTELFSESWSETTGEIPLYDTVLVIPIGDIPVPVLVEVVARGDLDAGVSAGVGPVWLSGICLDVDPVHGIYAGHAELHAQASGSGTLALTGSVTARAGWGCIFSVVDGTAGLTGRGTLSLGTELVDRVDVSCRGGEIVLDNTAWLSTCLGVLLGLDAHLQVRVFGFPVISERWTLLEREWGECWDVLLGVTSIPLGGGAFLDFDAEDPDARGLLEWLFRTATDDRQLLERLTRPAPRAAAGQGTPALATSGSGGPPAPGSGGLSMPADPAAASGVADPCDAPSDGCPVPVNFHQTKVEQRSGGRLYFEYEWDSSTGNQDDLRDVWLGELVDYPNGNPFVWPSPPWNGSTRNPEFHFDIPGTDPAMGDEHTSRPFKKPYRADGFTARQKYRYRTPCRNGGNPVDLTATIPIVRAVTQRSARRWKYTITKSGETATLDPLP